MARKPTTGLYNTREELVEAVMRNNFVFQYPESESAKMCGVSFTTIANILKKEPCPIDIQIEAEEAAINRCKEKQWNSEQHIQRLEELKQMKVHERPNVFLAELNEAIAPALCAKFNNSLSEDDVVAFELFLCSNGLVSPTNFSPTEKLKELIKKMSEKHFGASAVDFNNDHSIFWISR